MIALSDWKDQGNYETINGQQIFTRIGGDKDAPALVLIHGFPSASWDWEGMWEELTQRYYVITLDMLGFGLSSKPKNAAYLISEQADLFESLLARLNIDSYHILAHDYGDTVAQELLARQAYATDDKQADNIPIASVSFLNGGLFAEMHRPILIQKLLLSPLGFLVAKLISKQKFAANLQKIFGPATQPNSETIDTLWQLLIYNNGLAVMHKLINYIPQRKQHRERWVGAIIDSSIPIKLIAGSKDPISGQHMIDHYRKLIADANITTMPMLGHYPQIEDANAITTAYLAFRDSIS